MTEVPTHTGRFYKKGKCEVCGKHAEREKAFASDEYHQMLSQGVEWQSQPIRHKRCEDAPVFTCTECGYATESETSLRSCG